MVAPILDYNFKVDLCKKIYDNEILDRMTVSPLNFLKYSLSLVIKGIFEEDVLHEAFDKLD